MTEDAEPSLKIFLSKTDAATRQLRVAIALWFEERDPVAIHTLVAAAHEIIHTLLLKAGRPGLFFDADLIVPEYLKISNASLRANPNFFKHADRDAEAVKSFDPSLNEWFLLMCVDGLKRLGQPMGTEDVALMRWVTLHRPHVLLKSASVPMDAEVLEYLQSLTKPEFWKANNIETLLRAR